MEKIKASADSRITMRIPFDVREELEQIAKSEGRPLSNFIRNELTKMLERKKKKGAESETQP